MPIKIMALIQNASQCLSIPLSPDQTWPLGTGNMAQASTIAAQERAIVALNLTTKAQELTIADQGQTIQTLNLTMAKMDGKSPTF